MTTQTYTTRLKCCLKLDEITAFLAFQVGFCCDAVLWRLSQAKTEHIIFPAMIGAISLIALLVHAADRQAAMRKL